MYLFSFITAALGTRVIDWAGDDIKFYRELKGSGLKQDLYTKIDLPFPKTCTLTEHISKDWFIDIEELPNSPKFDFNTKIDIELPASLSTSHNYTITIKNSSEFFFPIHIRYNDCSYNQPYKKIFLDPPIINCEDLEYRVSGVIDAAVPIGKFEDFNFVILVTTVTVIVSAGLIGNAIRNFKNK
jgi:PIG-X / PBN1